MLERHLPLPVGTNRQIFVTIPRSDEVRFHSIKSAFEEDPEITEDVADAIALGLEALLFAAAIAIIALVLGAMW